MLTTVSHFKLGVEVKYVILPWRSIIFLLDDGVGAATRSLVEIAMYFLITRIESKKQFPKLTLPTMHLATKTSRQADSAFLGAHSNTPNKRCQLFAGVRSLRGAHNPILADQHCLYQAT